MRIDRVCVVGLGYIGLPTAALLAHNEIDVFGCDIDQTIVNTINSGKVHIAEKGLKNLVAKAVSNNRLSASITPTIADAYIIAVPTPLKTVAAAFPEPEITYVETAFRSIAPLLKKGDLIILESTSPVGTTSKMASLLGELRPDLKFPKKADKKPDVNLIYCPERMIPGNALSELVSNSRIIGGMTALCCEAAEKLYRLFVSGELYRTSSETAEMVKLTENASRDVEIAFANELSIVCDYLNLDVWEVIELSNMHPRVNILQPGPGVGGHCIAIDPWFIVSSAPEQTTLLQTARKINDQKPLWVVEKIKCAITEFLSTNPTKNIKDVKIAFYGATFKPDVDDLRESPAIAVIDEVKGFHAENLMIVEPNVEHAEISEIRIVDMEFAYANADISVLLVNHKEFTARERPSSLIVDTKGIWN